MLKFVDLKRETPEKFGSQSRKENFLEIYKEFIDTKAKEQARSKAEAIRQAQIQAAKARARANAIAQAQQDGDWQTASNLKADKLRALTQK